MASVILLGIKGSLSLAIALKVTAAVLTYSSYNATIVKNNATHDIGCGSSIC